MTNAEGQDPDVAGHGIIGCGGKIAIFLDVFLTIKDSEKRALSQIRVNWCTDYSRGLLGSTGSGWVSWDFSCSVGKNQGCLPFGQKIRKFRFEVKW